jgi:predicted MFS family arabinose efflux permease
MAFSIGMGVGPLMGGVVADFVNINSVFYFGAIAGLIGTILFLWFGRSKHT